MATMTLAAYRRPLFDPQDVLFRRCLIGAGVAGIALMVAMVNAPVRHPAITQVTQLPPRFARLIVDPKERQPLPESRLPVVPHHADPTNARPGGGGGGGHEGALSEPGPIAAIPGGGARNRAPGPVGPGAGSAGRARAQAEVSRALGGDIN